jgi:hypothetical protein
MQNERLSACSSRSNMPRSRPGVEASPSDDWDCRASVQPDQTECSTDRRTVGVSGHALSYYRPDRLEDRAGELACFLQRPVMRSRADNLAKGARLYNRHQQTRSHRSGEPQTHATHGIQHHLLDCDHQPVVADERTVRSPRPKCDWSTSSYQLGCSRASATRASTKYEMSGFCAARRHRGTKHAITSPNSLL